MSLVSAFTSAVLPIVVMMAIGYLLELVVDLDIESMNDIALYAFLPALVFHSLATTSLDGQAVAKIFGGVVAFVAAMMLVAEILDRLLGVGEPYRSADVLASSFPNAGFYGVPLATFAFGAIGRTTAVLFMAVQSFLMYTAGVYVASRGGGHGGLGAIREIFKLPLIYAILLAGIIRALGIEPPETGTMMTTVKLVGDASIPLMLAIVGAQLADIERPAISRVFSPVLLKLIVAPVVALGIAVVLAFENPDIARVYVLLCATPVAIIPLALTITYSDDDTRDAVSASEYLTTVIFLTTLLSIPVLTVLIAVLRSGAVL